MATSPFSQAVQAVVQGGRKPRAAAQELLDQLSLDERLGLLDGDVGLWQWAKENLGHYNVRPIVAASNPRIGLPGILFSDGPRGATLGNSTAFPAPSTRAAAWNPDLEEEIVGGMPPVGVIVLMLVFTLPGRSYRQGDRCAGRQSVWRRVREPRSTPWMGSSPGVIRRRSSCSWHHGRRVVPGNCPLYHADSQALCAQLHGNQTLRGRRLGG